MAPLKFVDNYIIFWLLLCLLTVVADGDTDSDRATAKSKIVKKVLNGPPPTDAALEAARPDEHANGPDGGLPPVIVISERTLLELQAAAKAKNETVKAKNTNTNKSEQKQQQQQPQQEHNQNIETPKEPWNNVVEETKFKLKEPYPDDDEIPESFKTAFYLFAGLSTMAVAFIVFKLYRMRLSRAERKYGVQGDRTTQELTPLPVSIEDVNSDEEDQTLFEINRQQIRIL